MTNGQDIQPLYLHSHNAANEPVTLHTGPVVLRVGARTSEGRGRLVLGFLPSTGLRLEVDIASGAAPDAGSRVQADVAAGVADALVNSVRMGFEEEKAFSSAKLELLRVDREGLDPAVQGGRWNAKFRRRA